MKKYDRNLARYGWYLGSYLLRFIEVRQKGNNDPMRRFLVWENTVIVKARDLDHAYDKVSAIAKGHTRPYKGGKQGIDVRWLFEGVTELLPIYEKLQDGAEIMWGERTQSLRRVRARVRPKGAFRQ